MKHFDIALEKIYNLCSEHPEGGEVPRDCSAKNTDRGVYMICAMTKKKEEATSCVAFKAADT